MSWKRFSPVVLALFIILIGCKPDPATLMTAVKANNTEEARKLLDKGADANIRTSPAGWSALHYAARNGNIELVQSLLKAGADPNYSGTMDEQKGTAISLKPFILAQATLDLINQVPPDKMDETLRAAGLNDPAFLKSVKDPNAADRYQKVVGVLGKVTGN